MKYFSTLLLILLLSSCKVNQPEKKRRAILTAYDLGSTVGAVLPFSRNHQKEADQIGLELMAIAGFNPEEASRLWERIKAASSVKSPPEILSTHPSNERRINYLTKWIPLAKKQAQEINWK